MKDLTKGKTSRLILAFAIPIFMANPLAKPIKKPIIRLLSVVVAPTAASEFSPRYDPTILVSTILYVSWSIFAINIGMANASMSLEVFKCIK